MHEADHIFFHILPGFTLVHSLSLQIFLNYTVAGSSFVFGDMLVKDVFAFQVISVLWAGMRVTVGRGVKQRLQMYAQEISQSLYQFEPKKRI